MSSSHPSVPRGEMHLLLLSHSGLTASQVVCYKGVTVKWTRLGLRIAVLV